MIGFDLDLYKEDIIKYTSWGCDALISDVPDFCKKVLEAHEGNIHLETNGNHNKFVINLPMLDENTVTISEIVL